MLRVTEIEAQIFHTLFTASNILRKKKENKNRDFGQGVGPSIPMAWEATKEKQSN